MSIYNFLYSSLYSFSFIYVKAKRILRKEFSSGILLIEKWTFYFFKEIRILEENKELENALKNIQLPKEEIKKLEVDDISKIF